MAGALSYHVNVSDSFVGAAKFVQTFSTAQKDFSVAAKDDVLRIYPTGEALVVFRYIFAPQIVNLRVGVGTDIVRSSLVEDVRPAEGEHVVADTGFVAFIFRVRSDDGHLQTWVTVFVSLANAGLVLLVEIFAHVGTVCHHVVVKSFPVLGGRSVAPSTVAGSKTVTQEEYNALLRSH